MRIKLYHIYNRGAIFVIILLFFCSIDKVPKVTSPVLVIHGTEDEVINFSHGLAIYERCPRAVEPLWVEVLNNVFITVCILFSLIFFLFVYSALIIYICTLCLLNFSNLYKRVASIP